FYCSTNFEDQINMNCSDEYYVDLYGNCELAPPQPCAYSCSGYCPDERNCSQYFVCDGAGDVLGGPFQCDEGSYFDPNNDPPFCSGTDNSVCTPVSKCDF
ncbi:Chitin binding domain, partial [Trinorchestia longiramus]